MKLLLLLGIACFAAVPVADNDSDIDGQLETLKTAVSAAKQESVKAPAGSPLRAEAAQKTEKGLAAMEFLGQSRPSNLKAQLSVAQALASVEEDARALPFAHRAVALAESQGDPKLLSKALTLRAGLRQKEGHHQAAYQEAVRALTLDPGNRAAFAVAMLTKGLTDGDAKLDLPAGATPAPAAARPDAAAPPRDPGSASLTASPAALKAQAMIKEAETKLRLGDPKAALGLLGKAVSLDPKNAQAYLARGKVHMALKDADAARHDLGAAIKRAPRLAEAYYLRGQTRERMREGQAVILEDLEAAAILDPARFETLYKEALARLNPESRDSAPGAGGTALSSLPVERKGHIGPKLGWIALLLAAAFVVWRAARRR